MFFLIAVTVESEDGQGKCLSNLCYCKVGFCVLSCLEELEALVSKIHRMQHSLVLSRFCQIKCACMKSCQIWHSV